MSNYREYQRVIRLSLNSPPNHQHITPQPASSATVATASAAATQRSSNTQVATPPSSSAESSPKVSPVSSPKPLNIQPRLAMEQPHTSSTTTTASSKEPVQKKKITRTKTGCFCCRRRKKKCDELKPSCSGCIRNMLTCVYPTVEDSTKKSATDLSLSSTAISKKSSQSSLVSKSSNIKTESLVKKIDEALSSARATSSPQLATNTCESPLLSSYSSYGSAPSTPQSICSQNGTHYISPLSSPTLKPVEDDNYSSSISSNHKPRINYMNTEVDETVAAAAAILVSRVPKYPRGISIKSLLN